jgi:peptide/nickel transport system permease protein
MPWSTRASGLIKEGAMKRDMTNPENIREEDLNDINKVVNAPEIDEKPPVDFPQQALDDTRRVKVISPSVLVAKRFFRNKLAMVGLFILVFMFAFCFLGGLIIPYRQEQTFLKYDNIMFPYASSIERTEYFNYYIVPQSEIHYSVRNMMNSFIIEMEASSQSVKNVTDNNGKQYTVKKLGDKIFKLEFDYIEETAVYSDRVLFAKYKQNLATTELESGQTIDNLTVFNAQVELNLPSGSFVYGGESYIIMPAVAKINNIFKIVDDGTFTYSSEPPAAGFEAAVKANLSNPTFSFDGGDYSISQQEDGSYRITQDHGIQDALYTSTYVFDRYDTSGPALSSEFKIAAYKAVYGSGSFDFDGKSYEIDEDDEGLKVIYDVTSGQRINFANMSTFVVRRYNGEDTLSIEFKNQLLHKVLEMKDEDITISEFTYYTVLLDEEGNEMLDENGEPVYGEADFVLERKLESFVLTNLQEKLLIDIYSPPSKDHLLGTDANGMDVLTRIMFGGRISLMVGFIVIILSMIIGVILGGIAGYFGKWIDNIIMRLVDIFNCIPTLPILIIMGALFDELQLEPYTRIMYLMVILGVLGWSGIARLVRGQILSLREQEFMIAAEATGIRASRRIFRHLVPNVMPQLIVNATMGLGGIIITESTLSFLGLGAKYPLATWGAMINAVSTASAMVAYTYIWIPVGVLICLTVIAFNFVGDGLRDAFDPKMKR